jgi:hypothetical protein
MCGRRIAGKSKDRKKRLKKLRKRKQKGMDSHTSFYDAKGEFICVIPSTNTRAMIDSVEKMLLVSMILNRQYIRLSSTGTGLANVRSLAMEDLRRIYPDEKERYIFWLDSDIMIDEDAGVIAQHVLEAEKRGVSFSANYMGMASDNAVYPTVFPYSATKERLGAIQSAELKKYKPFELRLGHAGLGLAYIKTPLDFVFHTRGTELDDYLFYTKNDIDLRYVPIKNRHQKLLMLEGE